MKEQFLKEFKDLLIRYNASIYSEIEGDTHGITDGRMEIDLGTETILTISGWEINASKIKPSIKRDQFGIE